jgi:hypothetical protein
MGHVLGVRHSERPGLTVLVVDQPTRIQVMTVLFNEVIREVARIVVIQNDKPSAGIVRDVARQRFPEMLDTALAGGAEDDVHVGLNAVVEPLNPCGRHRGGSQTMPLPDRHHDAKTANVHADGALLCNPDAVRKRMVRFPPKLAVSVRGGVIRGFTAVHLSFQI